MDTGALIALIGLIVTGFTSLLLLAYWLGRASMRLDDHDRRITAVERTADNIFTELRKLERLIVEGPPSNGVS